MGDGTEVGVAGIGADHFDQLRRVVTGSWLGREFQGRGIGKEMRAAVFTLGFDGFDADLALTDAWHDSAASVGVTKSLDEVETRRKRALRRDRPDQVFNSEMSSAHFATIRRAVITLHGLVAARDQLETERRSPGPCTTMASAHPTFACAGRLLPCGRLRSEARRER